MTRSPPGESRPSMLSGRSPGPMNCGVPKRIRSAGAAAPASEAAQKKAAVDATCSNARSSTMRAAGELGLSRSGGRRELSGTRCCGGSLDLA